MTQDNHNKPLNFKLVSKEPQVIKLGPKATKKHQRITLKSTETLHLRKVGFCTILHQRLVFQSPHDQIQTRKTFNKKNGNITAKDINFAPNCWKSFSEWNPQIHPKSLKIRLRTPRCYFCCSFGLPGCPQAANIAPQGPKAAASGLPNRKFWHQKVIASEVIGVSKK